MDTSSQSQNRRSRRSNVFLTATIEAAGATIPVKLRNLSADGALVEAAKLPPKGADVLFSRNELCERGRVIWTDGKHAGIAFNAKLDPEQVLRNVPKPRPKMPVSFRRPGLACRELSGEEKALVESWVWSRTAPRPGE